MFGEGSPQDWCTVVLVLDGVEARRKEDFTGEWTFSGLSPGLYTVLVYDPQPDTVASGYDPEPAVETEVEVTGETVGPSSPSPPSSSSTSGRTHTPSSTLTPLITSISSGSDTEPTVTDGIDDGEGNRRAISGENLWILIIAIGDCCVCKVALTSLFASIPMHAVVVLCVLMVVVVVVIAIAIVRRMRHGPDSCSVQGIENKTNTASRPSYRNLYI